jgi:hypothetical protein
MLRYESLSSKGLEWILCQIISPPKESKAAYIERGALNLSVTRLIHP